MSVVLLWIIGILVAAVGVAVSIALHEVGHLLPAKRFGVKVTQYMVGFGPTVLSRRRGETEYGVKAIPLGGYIRMIGMFPPAKGDPDGRLRASSTGRWALMAEEARRASAEEVDPADAHRAFYRLPVLRRIVIMAGGPFVNLLLAVLLTAIALSGIGSLTGTNLTLQAVNQCVLPATTTASSCSPSDPPTPAAQAGLRPGDTITSFAGEPVDTWRELQTAIRAAGTEPVSLGIVRDGRAQDLTITPILTEQAEVNAAGRTTGRTVTVGFLGISPERVMERQPLTDVPGLVAAQVEGTAGIVLRLPQRLVDVAQAAFGTEARDPNGPVGVVGVGRLAGELNARATPEGYGLEIRSTQLLMLLAGLNVALFVFNLIPLLPFDGGHIAGALWEIVKKAFCKIARRPDPGPVDVAKGMPIAYGVSLLLIGMSVLLLYADIVRPVQLPG